MFAILCVIDLVVLFFLSRMMTRSLSYLLHHATRKLSHTVRLFSLLLLPGTFVHELAHYIIALCLGVRVYNFVLTPTLEEKRVRLGSVSIEKTDPFRKLLIGLSPLVIGLSILFVCLWWIARPGNITIPAILGVAFIIFQISNTMFPSRADMSGTFPALLVLFGVLTASTLFIPGIYEFLLGASNLGVFLQGVRFLSWIVGCDILIVIAIKLLRR